jgi:hypothetical protein
MKDARPLLAALAVLAAVAAVVVIARRGQPPPSSPAVKATPQPTPIPGHLVLYFPGDDTFLHREVREVPELPPALAPRVRMVVEELVTGSRTGLAPAFPWAAAVLAVFIDRSGDAYIDLTAPPAGAVEGTDGEMALVYATTNSVVANCPGVQRVQLLFDGEQVATLGHLDLSRPLRPDPELVAP